MRSEPWQQQRENGDPLDELGWRERMLGESYRTGQGMGPLCILERDIRPPNEQAEFELLWGT